MVNSIADLKSWLTSETKLSWKDADKILQIEAPSAAGCSVWIVKDDDEWTVGLGEGWHDHFETEAQAVECCLQGCTGKIREVTKYRGNVPYHWSAQVQIDGQWQTVSTTGMLFFPFWRRKRVEYRTNPVIDAP